MSDCNWPTCGCRHNLTGGPWCKATVRPSITWTVFQPAAAIAALAMRERASKMIETHVLETQYDGSRVVVPSNLAKEDQHHRSLAKAIRALPTTFTAAELLAAAMQLPEVRSLVEAAIPFGQATIRNGVPVPGAIGRTDIITLRAALASIPKGANK